ncbi:MAG: elongation factor Ts, partial [Chloroflexota bacterium]
MVDIAAIKKLRDETGAGPLKAKKALEETGGDYDKAVEMLRQQGLAKAGRTLGKDRTMSEGKVEIYQHHDGRLGA